MHKFTSFLPGDEIYVCLADVKQAIEEIENFLSEINSFSDFQDDIRTKRALERNIEIIGEAVYRILNIKPDISISNARKIVNTRNRIIHGYDTVSDEIIWAIVNRDISALKDEVEELLGEG